MADNETIVEREQAMLATGEAAVAKLHEMVHGDVLTEVETDSGPVPSLHKWQADVGAFFANAAERAEAARDATFGNANVYPDLATGHAAVADGGQYQVVMGNEIVRYRRDSPGVRTEVARYPTSAYVAALNNAITGRPWRSKDAQPGLNSMHARFTAAVKAVYSVGLSPALRARPWQFGIAYKNDASLLDRMAIYAGDFGVYFRFSGSAPDKDNGPVWLKLDVNTVNSQGYFMVLIDYRELPDGVVCNAVSTNQMLLSQSVHLFWRPQEGTTPQPITPIPWRDSGVSSDYTTSTDREVASAILAIDADGISKSSEYRLTIFCKNDSTFRDRIGVHDADGVLWYNGSPTIAGKDNQPVWTTLTSLEKPGAFHVLVDFRKITAETLLFSSLGRKHVLSSNVFSADQLRKEIALINQNPGDPGVLEKNEPAAPRAIRVSVAGSSITWGGGYLEQSSYLNGIDAWLRNTLATSINAANMTLTGSHVVLSRPTFWDGSAVKLSGVGASAEFELYGDEMSAVIARERGNAGAALVELYVDGALYDTFTTFNDEPFETGLPISLVGDGATRKFDLGRAHTFGHVVTVNGVALTGGLYTGGHGGTFPASADYLVIKQMVSDAGVPTVRHFLYFRNAPASGAVIAGSFSAGESISYLKGFIGNVGKGLDTNLESPYGDGNTSYNLETPASLASGLGFRESDKRAVETWTFSTVAKRTFRLVVSALDPRATGATPDLYLNFATNRMHHLQNAGIGGWSASNLRSDSGLNSYRYINQFEPDVIILESCTNDDRPSSTWQGYRTLTGLTDEEVRQSDSANFYQAVTYVSPDNYTVQDARLLIESIGRTSLVIDATNATLDVGVGDVLVIGAFKGDNRRVVCRVVTGWDAATRTATWGRPLSDRCVAYIKKLDDLVGEPVMVKRSARWETAVRDLVDLFRTANPDVQILLGTSGPPNLGHRNLEGYRELAAKVAADKGCGFVDYYGRTLKWIYSTPPDTQLYLNASQSTVATGADRYQLFTQSGQSPTDWLIRVQSVRVDGIERLNDGCYVEGSYKYGWADSVGTMSKANSAVLLSPYYLVFTDNAPPPGAQVVVKYGASRWAGDDCHPGIAGRLLFAQAAIAGLVPAANKSFSALGAY